MVTIKYKRKKNKYLRKLKLNILNKRITPIKIIKYIKFIYSSSLLISNDDAVVSIGIFE